MRTLLVALCLLLSSAAYAQDKKLTVTPKRDHFTAQSCISTVAAASRTAIIDLGFVGPNGQAMSRTVVEVELTWNAAATVTMTCTESSDGGTTDFTIQDCTTGAGTCTSNDASWSKAVTASKNWPWRIRSAGFLRLECVFLCSGAGTDTLTVKSYQTTD